MRAISPAADPVRIVALIKLFLITLTCNRVPLHNFGEFKLCSNIIGTPTLRLDYVAESPPD